MDAPFGCASSNSDAIETLQTLRDFDAAILEISQEADKNGRHLARRQGVCFFQSRGDLLAKRQNDEVTVVPIPSSETPAEHERIRKSNDRDQKLEREGKVSRHNQGYDEAADGMPRPEIERVVE